MALAQTELPELKRFTFFVSRRFEEGRERFRLHMGYFATLAEAEEWLGVVRDIYPGAWAGEAPGRKLRERAAAAQAAQAQHAAGPQTQTRAPVPRAPEPPLNVPVVHAAPPMARAAPAVVKPPAPVARPAARAAVAPPARTTPATPPKPPVAAPLAKAPATPARKAAPPASAPAVRAAQPTRPAAAAAARPPAPAPRPPAPRPPAPAAQSPAAARPAASSPAPPAARAAAAPAAKPVFGDSNVREVLKALGDASATGETRLMRAPPALHSPPAESSSLSDTQVLKMLETRRPQGESAEFADVSHGSIPLLKPDDTGTRQALKEAVKSNAAVSFAVQLQWSVQPADLDKVPPLAIFSAYTLYTVEGSREGRKWYGLRLGFFSDAISAKQVAYYVRSEFTSVAVVPVSPQEKARATDQDRKLATLAAPAVPRSPQDEFKLIDDAPSVPGPPVPAPARPTQRVAVGRNVRQPPGAPRPRPAGKLGARAKSGPQTLEETLEILGASQLTIDNGNGETLNDSGVRHLRVEVQKNSPFSKLLERLSERMKKP